MQIMDLKFAFEKPPNKKFINFIYENLIGEGYLHKANERYYTPTLKLLNEVFLPASNTLTLMEFQIRYLSYNTLFAKNDLFHIFKWRKIPKIIITEPLKRLT